MQLVLVDHLPCSACRTVVIRLGLTACAKLGLLRVEGVTVFVLWASNRCLTSDSVNHINSVVHAVDHGVHTQTEEMLMVVGVDLGIHLCSPRTSVFTLVESVGVEDTGELDLRLDCTVLVEDPLACILVVCRCEDLLHNELARACDCDGVITEVGVLEKNSIVLLVDANGVLDCTDGTVTRRKLGVEIVDYTLAVAAQGERVGHVSSAVLAKIKSVLALVRMLWCTIRNDHLGQGKTVEDRSLDALVGESDVVQHDTLLVVETNVELEVLP
ncbi:hypothetical protein HG531_007207 [Fusarium graminearum]|nr:hypothetical protein HG531_007207 [Fusarium graminearum]